MRLAPYLVCTVLAALAAWSCSDSTPVSTAVTRPQLVAVDPADFLGNVRCVPPPLDDSDAGTPEVPADAVRSYVATLFDVTPDADGGIPNPGMQLASSPPTSCVTQVTFASTTSTTPPSYVVAGHRYVAQIDAYKQAPEELTPAGPGARDMLNAEGGVVPKAFTGTCGGYPPSPQVEAGTESAAGASGAAGAPGTCDEEQPPGVISYASITQTPHNCGAGLTTCNAPK